MSSCFFFWETLLWCLNSIQLWIWMIEITHLMMDDLMLSDFPVYHTSNVILGHIPSWLRFMDLHWFVWSSPLTRCMPSWWSIFFSIMIPQWSFSWAIQLDLYFQILSRFCDGVISGRIDSHTFVLVEYMSDFLDIPIGVFLSQWPMCSRSSSLMEYSRVNDQHAHFHWPRWNIFEMVTNSFTFIILIGVSLSW